MNHPNAISKRILTLALLIFLSVSACNAGPELKNVIFIIGDGMGIGAITAARCAITGENGQLVLDTMPVTGLVKTHSETKVVTDSAASGTALAAGRKTLNGSISVDSKGRSLPTILELANSMGKSTGVITTDVITGATPAVFYAHIDSRSKLDDIALQLVASKVTVAMGTGRQFFIPKTDSDSNGRSDGKDVTALAKQNGFEVLYDAKTMEASKSKRLLGLFTFDETGPTLESMLQKTISVLSQNKKGFFVMAESCLPDRGGHKNDAPTLVKGVADLDSALRYALEFAKKDKHTLIIVTADHETGGLAVLERDDKNPQFKPGWLHGGHTGNMVAVYAFGPGSEKFSGTIDNTEIPKIISSLWGRSLGK